MLQEMIMKSIKPLLDAEYQKGYSAGVSAEKVLKDKEWAEREYDLLARGKLLGRAEMLKELEDDVDVEIEEISAREFEELTNTKPEQFGFVGDMEHMTLVLDDVTPAMEEVTA